MRFLSRESFIKFIELLRGLGFELTLSSRGYVTKVYELPNYINRLSVEVTKTDNYISVILSDKKGLPLLVVELEKCGNVFK